MTFKEFVRQARDIKPEGTLFVEVYYRQYTKHVALTFRVWDGKNSYEGCSPVEVLAMLSNPSALPEMIEAVGEMSL